MYAMSMMGGDLYDGDMWSDESGMGMHAYPTWFRVLLALVIILIVIIVIVALVGFCSGRRDCDKCHASPCSCSSNGGGEDSCKPPCPAPCPPPLAPCPGFVIQAQVAITDSYFLPIEPDQGVPVNPWQTFCESHVAGCAYLIQVTADNRTNKTIPVDVADLTGHVLQYNCATKVWLDLGTIA